MGRVIAQLVLAKAPVGDVERSRFFRHEQHRFADAKAIGEHVGDGLALARTG